MFIPVCDSKDGAFITEQCNTMAGVCWCVDGNGREILNTREKVERGKRNCTAAVIKFKSDEKKGGKSRSLPDNEWTDITVLGSPTEYKGGLIVHVC